MGWLAGGMQGENWLLLIPVFAIRGRRRIGRGSEAPNNFRKLLFLPPLPPLFQGRLCVPPSLFLSSFYEHLFASGRRLCAKKYYRILSLPRPVHGLHANLKGMRWKSKSPEPEKKCAPSPTMFFPALPSYSVYEEGLGCRICDLQPIQIQPDRPTVNQIFIQRSSP